MTATYKHEVALSFAGEQRDYVREVNEALKSQGVRTFYDNDHAVELWGKNHTEELPRIYAQDTHLVLMFISENYVDGRWPRHERRAILTEMTRRDGPYLLPVRFDDSSVPGLDAACHYLEASKFTPTELAEAAYQQLVTLGVRTRQPDTGVSGGLTFDLTLATSASTDEPDETGGPVLPVEFVDLLTRRPRVRFEDVRRSLDFGVSQPVEVPAGSVTGIEDLIPPERMKSVRVVFQPVGQAHLEGLPFTIRPVDVRGAALGSYVGEVTHAGLGRLGSALEVDFHHGVTLELCFPFAVGAPGQITPSLDFVGLDPESTRRSARLALALGQADAAEVFLDGNSLGSLEGFTREQNPEYLRALQMTIEEADDLAFIQNETGVFFPMPDHFNPSERLWMRTIRLMLEGHAAPVPRKFFSGRALPGLDQSSLLEEVAFAVTMDGDAVTLAGHPVPLPDFFIYHPHVRIEGIREAVQDASAGVENAREFKALPVDGTPFVAYFPQRLRDDATQSVPWGLTSVEEPPLTTLRRGTQPG